MLIYVVKASASEFRGDSELVQENEIRMKRGFT